MRNILVALVVLFVIAVVGFTFLVPLYVNPVSDPNQETPEIPIPQLTEQELEKLGSKNNLKELDWLPSNGMYGIIAHPKRLLEASLLTKGADLLSGELARITMIPLDMTKIELLLSCTTIKQASIPAQPGEPATPRILPIPYVCYYLKLTEPIDKPTVFNQFLPPNQGFQPPKMRTVDGKEVYDLPSGFPLSTHALFFPDEKSLIYIMGDEELLKDVLDNKAPTGPLADRMARAKIDQSDLVILASVESGLPEIPPEIVSNFSKSNNLPETLVKLLLENFRAIQLTLNMSALENEPLLDLKFETLKLEGAKEIAKVLNEQLVFYRSSLSLLQSKNPADSTDNVEPGNTPSASPPPAEAVTEDWSKLGNQVLDSLTISSQDSTVFAAFRNFPDLPTYISDFFQNQRQQLALREAQEQQQKVFEGIFQRINIIRQYMIKYHDEKGQFPPTAICDAEGKPLLSWRVAILPYMGEQELYSQFKLDEPWDSPTNKPLVGKMPAIFGDARAYDPTRTTVRLFNSEGTPFAKPTLKMSDILGPQTTVMLVAVLPENAVEWTRPDSLAPCESIEEYQKLFGSNIPIFLFEGRAIVTPLLEISEKDRPAMLSRLKDMIEGKPVKLE